jgi:hypothetical protein
MTLKYDPTNVKKNTPPLLSLENMAEEGQPINKKGMGQNAPFEGVPALF